MDPEERWDSLTAQAQAYLYAGNPTRLHEIAQDLIECRPQESYGYRMAAESWFERENYKQAVELATKAVEAEPEDDFVIYRLAVFHRFSGNLAEAERQIRRAIEIDPDYPSYWVELGYIAEAGDDHDGAERYAQKALSLNPENVDARQLLSAALSAGGAKKRPQRLELLDRALESDPEDADVWDDKALLLLEMGRIPEAEDCARQALLLEPSNKYYRRTLYSVIKRRSLLYRVLRWPGDLVMKGFGLIDKMSWPFWIFLCVIGIGSRFFILLVALGALWLTTIFPVLKLYEWTTLSDIRARAKEVTIGKRRRDFFHRLPLAVRILCFALLAGGFWYVLYRLIGSDQGGAILGVVLLIAIVLALVLGLFGLYLEIRDRRRARARRKWTEEMADS